MKKRLKEHEERCFAFVAQRTEYPVDPILKFENIQKQVEASFTVYADFESILKQLSGVGRSPRAYSAEKIRKSGVFHHKNQEKSGLFYLKNQEKSGIINHKIMNSLDFRA